MFKQEAREGFYSQINKLSNIERKTSISINRCVDLGKTAPHIAAEDDSLISHSSVPLPVNAFIDRLDDLSTAKPMELECPDFDVEIAFPLDHGLPRGYQKQKSRESDQSHIMTVQILLEEILRNLKSAFWPFQHDFFPGLFLRTAHAANCIEQLNSEDSGLQLASANAAKHRLECGVWTNVRFGDMRCALAGM
ncbi:hypothetical protein Pint_05259 [Pistacia integerrima]|uniref:Uncharacterized protein n=1 Tax=Pistacia integerrima TaxID=434235 RepID=A0ACC0Z984_9ROSI|nr:hypothetical protein Pint_05259 [Pistacia integerrima]